MLGFCLAAMQFLDGKRRTESERERLAAQRERLRTAASAARLGVGSADLIVQRAKDRDVTIGELQNLARQLRGSLDQLAKQIETEGETVASRAQGGSFSSRTAADIRADTSSKSRAGQI